MTYSLIAKNKMTGRKAQELMSVIAKQQTVVLFTKDSRTINTSSLLGLLSLAIVSGDQIEVTIITQEDDADRICSIIKEIL